MCVPPAVSKLFPAVCYSSAFPVRTPLVSRISQSLAWKFDHIYIHVHYLHSGESEFFWETSLPTLGVKKVFSKFASRQTIGNFLDKWLLAGAHSRCDWCGMWSMIREQTEYVTDNKLVSHIPPPVTFQVTFSDRFYSTNGSKVKQKSGTRTIGYCHNCSDHVIMGELWDLLKLWAGGYRVLRAPQAVMGIWKIMLRAMQSVKGWLVTFQKEVWEYLQDSIRVTHMLFCAANLWFMVT